MEKLIEFLIRNIYIVIVVGGFLLSAIGKMRNNNKGPRSMPTFGNGDELPSIPVPARRTSLNRPSASARPVSGPYDADDEAEDSPYAASSLRPVEQRQSRPAAQTVAAAPAPQRVPQRGASSVSPYVETHPADNAAPELSAATLRQAIVWSEVLGPPRAKRPWRSK